MYKIFFLENYFVLYYGSNYMNDMSAFWGDTVLDLLLALCIDWIYSISVSCLTPSFGISSIWIENIDYDNQISGHLSAQVIRYHESRHVLYWF